jgi:hypothetical protein
MSCCTSCQGEKHLYVYLQRNHVINTKEWVILKEIRAQVAWDAAVNANMCLRV